MSHWPVSGVFQVTVSHWQNVSHWPVSGVFQVTVSHWPVSGVSGDGVSLAERVGTGAQGGGEHGRDRGLRKILRHVPLYGCISLAAS